MPDYFDFVVVGGGIAGVVCAETLCGLLSPLPRGLPTGLNSERSNAAAKVCIISASKTLKTAVNVKHITRLLQSFEIAEISGDKISSPWPDLLTIITDVVLKLEHCCHFPQLTECVIITGTGWNCSSRQRQGASSGLVTTTPPNVFANTDSFTCPTMSQFAMVASAWRPVEFPERFCLTILLWLLCGTLSLYSISDRALKVLGEFSWSEMEA
uniref:Pyridine nucleotide-disulfide oxidoreductase domain-containing protein 1 n=1 Tax=Schistocephalus solidus TaxID=70667 RepID=A0A0X3Q571_SCHSO